MIASQPEDNVQHVESVEPCAMSFRPALIIVDYQYDFCPPHGSLAVPGALDLVPILNDLLALPFTLKIATRDFHPADHVSFASNHPAPHNKPFETISSISNPHNAREKEDITLWPDHCVQGTHGCQLVEDLHLSSLDAVVDKGQDPRVEMLSAFSSVFADPPVISSNLTQILRDKDVTHVYVAGLATDYCVKQTAVDASKNGFCTVVVRQAVRGIDSGRKSMAVIQKVFDGHAVRFVDLDSPEMDDVRRLSL